MYHLLAIETSIPNATISLKVGNHSPVTKQFESHRQQNQLLFPPLQELLELIPEGDSLDAIIIGTGPGSYSGSRIAIAAALGVASIHSCPVVGQSSLLAHPLAHDEARFLATGDARRGAFYISEVQRGQLPSEPQLLEREDFETKVQQADCPVVTIDQKLDWLGDLEITACQPTAADHLRAWESWDEATRHKLLATPAEPAYLRAPFITKAKPGHPLLRGKVNSNKR
ncbi:tRNA (adenosine(37)-N6)-threonylcarbamoyltransferase complex dimerization subunit type 1 TsaB [Rubritalea marina]|uniref:tRNA (adenosine(37)-N6)-threonylcarbamoyltransferase complex dimerization subunit type 1 TsaB n=1 Tax=Rubritalea marina TaxID=361055 RepID=UPI000360DC9A|nr:tRNA (adenosine(37)-N6)-threonylcarbamoyltransferase complex dimerization subunit type 1 TsaB [Rubritalea marina]